MKKRVNVYIEEYDWEFIKSVADEYDMSFSDMLSIAIDLISNEGEGVPVLAQIEEVGRKAIGAESGKRVSAKVLLEVGAKTCEVSIS